MTAVVPFYVRWLRFPVLFRHFLFSKHEISVFFSGTALLIGFDIINLNYCIYFRLVCFSLWRNEISFKLLTFTLLERKKRGVLPETNELFLNFNKSQIFALRCMLLVLDLHIFHIHYHKKILFTNTFCSHFCFHSGMLCKSRSALSCTDTFHVWWTTRLLGKI